MRPMVDFWKRLFHAIDRVPARIAAFFDPYAEYDRLRSGQW